MPINGPDKWFEPRGGRFDGGGGGGDDGRMENRIHALETATAGMREDIAVIKATMATKDDMAKLREEMAKVRDDMAKIRDDMAKSFIDVHKSLVDMHKSLADMHSSIAGVSKAAIGWMIGLTAIFGGIVTLAKIFT